MSAEGTYEDGVRDERARCVQIAGRFAEEIEADLERAAPRVARVGNRMRGIAALFEGLAELLATDDNAAVNAALSELRDGFRYVAKRDVENDFAEGVRQIRRSGLGPLFDLGLEIAQTKIRAKKGPKTLAAKARR